GPAPLSPGSGPGGGHRGLAGVRAEGGGRAGRQSGGGRAPGYPIAPDASDSAFAGAREALVRGVEAAKREARRRGYSQLAIGFNWFWRTDPANERSFWSYLARHGGRRFARAVDWVGLDAYPGTIFPPAEPPGGYDDGIVAAISQLRKCFMPIAGLG